MDTTDLRIVGATDRLTSQQLLETTERSTLICLPGIPSYDLVERGPGEPYSNPPSISTDPRWAGLRSTPAFPRGDGYSLGVGIVSTTRATSRRQFSNPTWQRRRD
jgi:hypothetical protein